MEEYFIILEKISDANEHKGVILLASSSKEAKDKVLNIYPDYKLVSCEKYKKFKKEILKQISLKMNDNIFIIEKL